MQWSSCAHLGIKVSRITSGTAVSGAQGARLRGSWPKGCNWPAHSAGDHTGLMPRYQRAALTPPQPDWVANPARQHIGAYFATTGIRRISRADICNLAFALVGEAPGRSEAGPCGCNGQNPATARLGRQPYGSILPNGATVPGRGGSRFPGVATSLRALRSTTSGRRMIPRDRAGFATWYQAYRGSWRRDTGEMKRSPGCLYRGPSTPARMRATTSGHSLPEIGTGTPKIAAPSFKVAPMCGFLPLRRRRERAAQLSRPGSIPRGLARARGLPPLLSPRTTGSRPVLGSWGSGGRVPPPYSVGNGEISPTGLPLLAVSGQI